MHCNSWFLWISIGVLRQRWIVDGALWKSHAIEYGFRIKQINPLRSHRSLNFSRRCFSDTYLG